MPALLRRADRGREGRAVAVVDAAAAARAGMRPISNVVDITNYVMLELGQPLHAFDYDLLRGARRRRRPTIIMRRAHPGEHLTTLDGVDRALDPDMLMITDTAGTIAVGGVMGGANTEVNDGTTSVLLEAANFDFLSIRRTSQLLKLSQRGGQPLRQAGRPGADREGAGARRSAAGGVGRRKVRPIYGDVYPAKPQPRTIDLDPTYVNRPAGRGDAGRRDGADLGGAGVRGER